MNNKVEEWRPIMEFCGRFSISSAGRVRREFGTARRKAGSIVPSHPGKNGYPIVTFYFGKTAEGKNDQATRYVHALVAREFIGARPDGYDVCHNDGNRQNNCVENLRYDTRSGNCRDKIAHGTSNREARSAVTRNEAGAIMLLARDGHRREALAKFLGVKSSTVKAVMNGSSYAWLSVELREDGIDGRLH